MADQKKPLFAAIPLQAIGDRRLSAAHFQVLAIIAWHDQFGANGIGCYASLKTLVKETGLAETTISECTGQLEAFGLLAKARHPLNRRTKVYSLIYKGNPRILPETGNCPTDHGAAGTKLPESGNDPGATLRVENREVTETVEKTGSKYITRSVREKIQESSPLGKSSKLEPARAREADGSPAGRAREVKKSRKADDDSTVDLEAKKTREAKKSREALASKAGKDPSEFDSLTWCAWLNLTYSYDRNAAADLIVRWDCDARQDLDRVKRALCEAHTRKPPDVEAFMAERLKGLGS